ncbi:MAG: hypothetical protein QOD92_1677 [Acidimicrobiaceae bacterium]|jgi:hypothetical protein
MRVAALVFGVTLAALLVIGGVVAFRLGKIASDFRRARTLIESASTHIEQGQLGPARTELSSAQQLLTTTNGRLYGQPELELVGWVPGIKENLDSLRSSVGLALQMVNGGNTLLEITQPLENQQGRLEVSLNHGAIPLQTVRAAQVAARDLAQVLPGATEEPSGARLVGPIADLQHRIYSQAARRRSQLDNVSRALSILSDMAGGNGPRRYLIAVANTAEMRGAGGMVLSYGVLEATNGTFSLGNFGSIDELAIDQAIDPASLSLPEDYLTRWAGQQPTLLWRNTTLAPDFSFAAPDMEAMFSRATQLPVDGVIQIDPAGLGAILQGTGPIDVSGIGSVSADNVVDLVLNRAYIDVPSRDQRQELLGDVAKTAFNALINGDFASLRPFGDALFKTAQQRHLIFYANDSTVREQVGYFGADGALPLADTQDYALLTVQNFSKNKLDYYIDSSVDLVGSRPRTRVGQMQATISIANTAPADGKASYVFGPATKSETVGLYRGIVSLYLPTGVSLSSADGPTTSSPVATSEAGRTLVTFGVEVPAGETRVVTLALVFPPRPAALPYMFRLVPVPRIRPTVFSMNIDAGDTRVSRGAEPLLTPTVLGAPPPVGAR